MIRTIIFSVIVILSLSAVATAEAINDLIFIHHSCGSNWLGNSLHDALLAKDYIDERNDITYGTDVAPDASRPDSLGPEPGDHTNMNHWILWFNDYLQGVRGHDCADGFNRIIMFKSCYPISNVTGDGTEPGDPFSGSQTVTNYKAVYRHPDGPGNTYTHNTYTYKPLEDIFAENPDILFIPVTAPPRHYAPSDATTDAEAHRARVFNNWLKTDWLASYNAAHPGLNNVAVFDWFDVLAYPDDHSSHPNRLKAEYGGENNNSHPNSTANAYSTEVFATDPDNFIDDAWDAFDVPLAPADFDGDGLTDIGVYRPSTGEWYLKRSTLGSQTSTWGGDATDVPVPEDYDGDGGSDLTVYRSSTGWWYVKDVGNYLFGGLADDIPVPGDYDGDENIDLGVYRSSTGWWYVKGVGNYLFGGLADDIPVPGDYDGDGNINVAVYRSSTGWWYVKGLGMYLFGGLADDIPVPGDYDGDGSTDIALFRPSTGWWYIRNVGNYRFGQSGDIPVPGDYDGDGTIDIAVFRPSTQQWYIKGATSIPVWGLSTDTPLTRNIWIWQETGLLP